MTREEAIKILIKLREHYCKKGIFEAEALNMAIKALEQFLFLKTTKTGIELDFEMSEALNASDTIQ